MTSVELKRFLDASIKMGATKTYVSKDEVQLFEIDSWLRDRFRGALNRELIGKMAGRYMVGSNGIDVYVDEGENETADD